jgi:hypothetical protein
MLTEEGFSKYIKTKNSEGILEWDLTTNFCGDGDKTSVSKKQERYVSHFATDIDIVGRTR